MQKGVVVDLLNKEIHAQLRADETRLRARVQGCRMGKTPMARPQSEAEPVQANLRNAKRLCGAVCGYGGG
jgi:hypothetical protein